MSRRLHSGKCCRYSEKPCRRHRPGPCPRKSRPHKGLVTSPGSPSQAVPDRTIEYRDLVLVDVDLARDDAELTKRILKAGH